MELRLNYLLKNYLSEGWEYKILNTKYDEKVAISYSRNMTTIRLFELNTFKEAKHDMYCFTKIKDDNSLFIDDISGRTKRKGYGTLIINEIIEFCRKKGINKITGEIGAVYDSNNTREDLKRFYKSFNLPFSYDKNNNQFTINIV